MTAAITDFNQFTSLRTGANADPHDPEVLREVAGQFEALFIQSMFKNMRDTSLADPIFGQSDQHEMYQEMLDQQYALEMSGGRGIGLSDMLVRQLGGEVNPVPNAERQFNMAIGQFSGTPASPGGAFGPEPFTRNNGPLVHGLRGSSQAIPGTASGSASIEAGRAESLPKWSSPREFARKVWPYAEMAAKKLNVAPEAIVAQAALETGWGEHVMQSADGSSSHNLFGIKASHNWAGGTVTKPTVEYRDGVMQRERAAFRAYPDLAATFEDYAEFLGEHPRYQGVSNHGNDTAGFASALQKAGYATDPDYADKINAILDGDILREALSGLKINGALPIPSGHSRGIGP